MHLFRYFLVFAAFVQSSACSTSASPPNNSGDELARPAGSTANTNIAAPLSKMNSDQLPGITETRLSALEFADQRFKDAGIDSEFVASLHHSFIEKHSAWREEAVHIIELNVFGFLAHSDYSLHDTPRAKKQISTFLKSHRKSFREAREKYNVPSRVVASLLWVETKHGKVMGKFLAAWVYFALSLSAHPDFTKEMLRLLPAKLATNNPKNLSLHEAEIKVIERCKTKSIWAIDEMKALNFIRDANYFNPLKTKASFAGAFGLGQFIPSTYLKFSVSLYRKKVDLFKVSDAVLSVSHFLKENGWNEGDLESQTKALFSYNHSKDYGSVILKLANDASHSDQ